MAEQSVSQKDIDVIRAFLDAELAVRLLPIARLIAGLETALVQAFNMLDRHGAVPLQAAIASLQATREGLPESVAKETHIVLRHLELGLERLRLAGEAPLPPVPTSLN